MNCTNFSDSRSLTGSFRLKPLRCGTLLTTACLLLLLLVPGCREKSPVPPLIEVGRRQLSLDQFQQEWTDNRPKLEELSEPDLLQLKKRLVNRLVERELILGEADRLGIRLSPDEMDQALRELRGGYSPEEFDQALRAAGQTPEAWTSALRLRLLMEKVSRAVQDPAAQVTDAEIEDYYRIHREEFRRPAELHARQMLFASIEDAEAILQRLRQGEDFAGLAKSYSLSPDRDDGGDLGYFSQGQLPPEFDRVLFALPTGRVSDPVESPYGFHLFLVESRRKAGLRPLSLVKDEIHAKLTQEREETSFQCWLDELHRKTKVRIHWELLTSTGND